jgi:hypothetical protein
MSAVLVEAAIPKGSRTWEWDRRLSGDRELLARKKDAYGASDPDLPVVPLDDLLHE